MLTEYGLPIKSDLIGRGKRCFSNNAKINSPPVLIIIIITIKNNNTNNNNNIDNKNNNNNKLIYNDKKYSY